MTADTAARVADHGEAAPPRSYDEATALRHLFEALATAVRENHVTSTLIWTIETNARLNNSMRPRLRAEGVIAAAAASEGSSVSLVAWAEIASLAGADAPKATYEEADTVCGITVGDADSFAVLVAAAALKT